MHATNFSYLTRRLEEAGFGKELHETLKDRLMHQPSSFELPHKVCIDKQVLELTVYVRKWKEVEQGGVNMYYIQKYHASLSREGRVDPISQYFYFGHSNPSVTIQQAYNLLCGRAVDRENLTNKDRASYNAWVQLDFTQTDSKGNYKWQLYNDHYGYNLSAELLKYPIIGLSLAGVGDALIKALQQGYREEVLMLVDGKEERYFLEALPRFKSLVIYNTAEHPITPETRAALLLSPESHGSSEQAPSEIAEEEQVQEEQPPKRKRIPVK